MQKLMSYCGATATEIHGPEASAVPASSPSPRRLTLPLTRDGRRPQ
jgi:hypothetical protein